MPYGNGMGPAGMGPMSGRAAGFCAGFGMPGYEAPRPGRSSGVGLGHGGGGGGRGWRHVFRASGLPALAAPARRRAAMGALRGACRPRRSGRRLARARGGLHRRPGAGHRPRPRPAPFRVRAGRHALCDAGITPAQLFGLTPLFDRLPLPCHVVSPQPILHSDFNVALSGKAQRHGYETLDEMFAVIAGILRSDAPRSYVYAYWPQLDSLAHEHGIHSDAVAEAFAALDAAFARLLDTAHGSDSLVIVTADHGFIDTTVEATIDLGDHPELRETLLLPLCGEPRMAYAYVRAGRERQFENTVRGRLADRVHLIRSEDVLRQGWLGPGTAHPALQDRLGDYVLIPRGQTILRDWLKGEERHTHIGVHGGLGTAEMLVPLVVAALS